MFSTFYTFIFHIKDIILAPSEIEKDNYEEEKRKTKRALEKKGIKIRQVSSCYEINIS